SRESREGATPNHDSCTRRVAPQVTPIQRPVGAVREGQRKETKLEQKMKELREILGGIEAVRERGEDAILATVVEVRGSTYRRAGARLLLDRSGWVAGGISGGCLEGDVLR